MTPAGWARTHLGERVLRLSGAAYVMDTDDGIVAQMGQFNVGVVVGDDGWRVRLWVVVPASRILLEEWRVPAIHVPSAFLNVCGQVSDWS